MSKTHRRARRNLKQHDGVKWQRGPRRFSRSPGVRQFGGRGNRG